MSERVSEPLGTTPDPSRRGHTVRSDDIVAAERTQQLAPVGPADPDPLAKITLSPRGFATVLATAGLLIGLLLALIPVHVAGPDPARLASVSCGNTIGGVETDIVAGGLDHPDRQTIVSYVDMCERAVGNRMLLSWPLFFAGGLGIIWLGAVRPRAVR